MTSGRSLAGFAGSHPQQGDQSETVNTKPGCRAVRRVSAAYVLRELEHASRPTKELKVAAPDLVHVEHIYPQTPKKGSKVGRPRRLGRADWEPHSACRPDQRGAAEQRVQEEKSRVQEVGSACHTAGRRLRRVVVADNRATSRKAGEVGTGDLAVSELTPRSRRLGVGDARALSGPCPRTSHSHIAPAT
jgi:hypothetical protein